MLRLPPIPERTLVRHVVLVLPELDRMLRAYAAAYAESYGAARPVAELIPAMLAAFIEGDRAFARLRRAHPKPTLSGDQT